MAGNVSLTVKLKAQDQATKVIRATKKANDDLVKSLQKIGAAQTALGAKVALAIQGNGRFRQALIKSADSASWLATKLTSVQTIIGSGFILMGAQQFYEFAKGGAAAADQLDAVAHRVANSNELIEEITESTKGMIPEAEIVNAIALFDSFGLNLEQLPALLEQAAKTSIRTGKSVEYLIGSSVEGIAKLQPMILDNLGLQVKLTDATKKAAAQFGVQAKAVSKTQQQAGMLAIILEQLGRLNADVDLNNSRVASLNRLESSFANTTKTIAKNLASFVTGVSQAGRASAHLSNSLANIIKQTMGTARKEINRSIDALAAGARKAIQVDKELIKLGLEKKAQHLEEAALAKRIAQIRADAAAQQAEAAKAAKKHALGSTQSEKEANARAFLQRRLNQIAAKTNTLTKQAIKLAKEEATAALAGERADIKRSLAAREAIEAKIDDLRGGTETRRAIAKIDRKIAEERKLIEEERKAAEKRRGMSEKELAKLAKEKKKDLLDIALSEDYITRLTEEKLRLTKEDIKESKRGLKLSRVRVKAADTEADAKEKARLEAEKAFARLVDEVALLGARDAMERASLAFEIERARIAEVVAEIEDETTRAATERLMLRLAENELTAATLQHQREMSEEIRQQNQGMKERQLAAIQTIASGVEGAFGEGASMLSKMDEQLRELGRPEKFAQISAGFQNLGPILNEATMKFAELGSSSMSSGKKVASGVAAGLGAIGPAVAGFVGGVKEQAVIMGLFETAMAVATAFTNVAESISHGIAAGMFFAMAGVAAAQPTTPAPAAASGGGTGVGFGGGGGASDPGTVVVNIGEGMVFGRPGEIGRAVAERMNSMSDTGMEATSF